MTGQRYYREKFKPTKGAFGGTSKYNRRLKEAAKVKAQVKAQIEEKNRKETEKKEESSKTDKKKVEDSKEVKTGNDNDLKKDGN